VYGVFYKESVRAVLLVWGGGGGGGGGLG